jgi:hypothetical protein
MADGTPIEGLTVTFASTAGGASATFTPGSATTDATGTATSEVIVPYDTQVVVEVSGGGAVATHVLASGDTTIALYAPTFTATGMTLPTGEVFVVTTTAVVGSSTTPVQGVSITFSSLTTGVTLSPTTALTNGNGVATSYVVAPYNTPIVVEVAGAGTVAANALATAQAPTITLAQPTFTPAGMTFPTGELYEVTTQATSSATNVPVEGLSIAFTTSTTGLTFSPTTVVADTNGMATSYVIVPYDAQVVVEVSGGGAVATKVLPTDEAPTIMLAQPTFSATTTMLPTGQLFAVTTTATLATGTMTAVEGLAIAFTTTTAGLTFSPTPVTTDTSGTATSYVIVPYNSAIAVEVSGGGTVAAAILPSSQIPALTLQLMSPAVKVSTTPDSWSVTATVANSNGPAAGVGVAFAVLASSTQASIAPATVTTNAMGQATAYVGFPASTTTSAVVVASINGTAVQAIAVGP